MRPIHLLLSLSLVTTAAFGQKEPRFTLVLNNSGLCQAPLPFAALKVIDARFDRDIVGCVAKSLSFKGTTKHKTIAVFPDSLKNYLPTLLQQGTCFDKTKTDTLVMLVKQWRVTDHVRSTLNKYAEAESILLLSCSFFQATGDQLVKLFSVDELMAENWQAAEDADEITVSQQRSGAVSRLVQRVFANRSWQPSTVRFSLAEVTEGLNKRFQLPLYTDSTLVVGVYKTFTEFKNNRLSAFDVRIGRRYDGSVVELQDLAGNQIDIRSIWGLCDGKQRYISFQSGLHPLSSVGKSFRFIFHRRQTGDIEEQQSPTLGLVGGLIYPGNAAIRRLQRDFQDEYLYLNLETGAVHIEEIIGTAPARKLRTKSR